MQDITDKIFLKEGDSFEGSIKKYIRRITEGFKPDEDIIACIFIKKDNEVTINALSGGFFEDVEAKNKLAYAVLPTIILAQNCDQIAFFKAVWMVQMKKGEYDTSVVPSEHPDRVEGIMLDIGDVESMKSYFAKIARRPILPPILGEFELLPGTPEGRMYDPLIDALNFNRNPTRDLGAKIIINALSKITLHDKVELKKI